MFTFKNVSFLVFEDSGKGKKAGGINALLLLVSKRDFFAAGINLAWLI